MATDSHNCGTCGSSCTAGQTCCGGQCVDPSVFQTDTSNCGACGNICGAGMTCCKGQCVSIVTFMTDATSCGGCGVQCNTPTDFGRVCVGGSCQCGYVGQPCCQHLYDGQGYDNGCQGASGESSGCPTKKVGCDSATCTCQCVDAVGFSGFLPDFRSGVQCPGS